MSVWELIREGGIALIPLGLCSILVIAIALDRMWAFARMGRIPRELLRRAENLLVAGQWQEAIRQLDNLNNPFARIAKAGLMRKDATDQEIADLLTLACDTEVADASKAVPWLGTIGNIAPFIGLFGTVIGIMKAFERMASQGDTGMALISAGIAEALIATAAGLAVGIAAVVANNWANAWLERYRLELERFATEWGYSLESIRDEAAEKQAEKQMEPVA